MKPRVQSGCASRSSTAAIVRSSGTSCPAASSGATRRPSGVPTAIARLNMSPLLRCGTSSSSASSLACVPLLHPCGPTRT
jgi:hypothetical protein